MRSYDSIRNDKVQKLLHTEFFRYEISTKVHDLCHIKSVEVLWCISNIYVSLFTKITKVYRNGSLLSSLLPPDDIFPLPIRNISTIPKFLTDNICAFK